MALKQATMSKLRYIDHVQENNFWSMVTLCKQVTPSNYIRNITHDLHHSFRYCLQHHHPMFPILKPWSEQKWQLWSWVVLSCQNQIHNGNNVLDLGYQHAKTLREAVNLDLHKFFGFLINCDDKACLLSKLHDYCTFFFLSRMNSSLSSSKALYSDGEWK